MDTTPPTSSGGGGESPATPVAGNPTTSSTDSANVRSAATCRAPSDSSQTTSFRGARQLLRDLRENKLTISDVPVAERRDCVLHLTTEGYSRGDIAMLLNISETTVTRDRTAIRKENALQADPALAGQFAGEFLRTSESIQEQVRRISREANAPAAVRLNALKTCFKMALDTLKLLQSLGCIPIASGGASGAKAQALPSLGPKSPDSKPITLDQIRTELHEEARKLKQAATNPNHIKDYEMFEYHLLNICDLLKIPETEQDLGQPSMPLFTPAPGSPTKPDH